MIVKSIKILIVEDDREINRLTAEWLSSQNYIVESTFQGLDALELLKRKPDISLVLLDLMLPLKSGDCILQKIREFSNVPVIIVSAKDTIQTKIDLIRMGADDYITKPFDLDELSARIEAVLRRSVRGEETSDSPLIFGEIVLNPKNKTVLVSDKPLDLTATEYAILELLVKNPTKLFSKANLFESVWNEPYMGDENTIKVHISNLRNKIKACSNEEYIQTVWGIGYRLKA